MRKGLSCLGASDNDFARHEDQEDHLGLRHAVDKAREQLRLILHVSRPRVERSVQGAIAGACDGMSRREWQARMAGANGEAGGAAVKWSAS